MELSKPGTESQSKTGVQLLRTLRYAFLWSLSPFDSAWRRLNRLEHYPPLHLRRHVGLLGAGFNGPGYEFASYLRLLLKIQPDQRLWDLGCGCGMLELALEDLGWKGSVLGTDIHRPCIDWANRTISRRIPSYSFQHADVYNSAYWPKGKLNAGQWLTQFCPDPFDAVVAKSFFTHVLPDELDVYFEAISRRLRPGGQAFLTFFLLNDTQKRFAEIRQNRLAFHKWPHHDHVAVFRPQAPTAAVAYEESWLIDQLKQHGLKTEKGSISHGSWTGNPDGLSFQDIVVVKR